MPHCHLVTVKTDCLVYHEEELRAEVSLRGGEAWRGSAASPPCRTWRIRPLFGGKEPAALHSEDVVLISKTASSQNLEMGGADGGLLRRRLVGVCVGEQPLQTNARLARAEALEMAVKDLFARSESASSFSLAELLRYTRLCPEQEVSDKCDAHAGGARYGGGVQTQVQPRLELWGWIRGKEGRISTSRTWVQPRFNRSTQVQPRFNPGSTQVQPRFRPRFDPV